MEQNSRPPFIVIAGPTASGKTEIAVELALLTNGEIISADSMQVYKHLSIGTAKPDAEETKGIPYHLIDHVCPAEQYTMGRFVREASQLLDDIYSRGRLPIVCGGTGLYLRGLLYGMTEEHIADDEIRRQLDDRLVSEGLPALYKELQNVDPASGKKIQPNDRQRILRALEVTYSKGQPASTLHNHPMTTLLRDCRCVYLSRTRAALYDRINRRVDTMVKKGLVTEVKDYLAGGFSISNPAFKALGYSEIASYLNGLQTFEAAVDHMKRRTRQFAKRQETWFRGMPCFSALPADGVSVAQLVDLIAHTDSK